jgi:ATP-dependent RNA helicase DDX46/PRP5
MRLHAGVSGRQIEREKERKKERQRVTQRKCES